MCAQCKFCHVGSESDFGIFLEAGGDVIDSVLRDIETDRVEYFSEPRKKMLSNITYTDDTDYNISII